MGCLKNEKPCFNQRSLYDRVEKLLVSLEWSDCSFHVSDRIFKAHRLILGISSPVFEAMLYGPLSSNKDIDITDILPDTFQLVLNYIYTDKVEITCIEQAFELLYSARKYMLEHLSQICVSFIQTNISIDNVIDIVNYPDYMQDEQLIKYSLNLVCVHADYLLKEKKNFITHPCMKAILENNQINMSEKDLIKHVFGWSFNCCEQLNIPATMENRLSLLKNKGIFQLLRFLTLSVDDFEEIVSDTNNLLQSKEYQNIKDLIKDLKSFNEFSGSVSLTPRSPIKLTWYLCYRSPLRPMAPIFIDSNNFVIHSRVKSNKSVFINSLCVPTRMEPAVYFRNNSAKVYSEQLSVSIASESDNSIIKFTNFMNTVEYDSIVDIELTEPCFIKKDVWYKISFIWPHNKCPSNSYIVEYRDKKLYTSHNSVIFEFDDLQLNAGNGGSFLGGLKFCL